MYVLVLELGMSDSENNTIMIVKAVVFMFMNTVMIVGLLNVLIHKYHDYKQRGVNLSSINYP